MGVTPRNESRLDIPCRQHGTLGQNAEALDDVALLAEIASSSCIVLLAGLSGGCAARAASVEYLAPPEERYSFDRAAGVELATDFLANIGAVVENVQVLDAFTIVSSNRMSGDGLEPGALECRENWKGIFSGGWVNELGGITLTIQLRDADTGTSVTIRETATDGCVPSGLIGRRLKEALDAGSGGSDR